MVSKLNIFYNVSVTMNPLFGNFLDLSIKKMKNTKSTLHFPFLSFDFNQSSDYSSIAYNI